MRLLIVFLLAICLCSAKDKEDKPTIETLQARIAQLEQQLAEASKKFTFEMAVCGGALQGARQAVVGQQQTTKPVSPPATPPAKVVP